MEPSRDCAATLLLGPSAHTRGRLAMETTARTDPNKTIVPKRMAQLLVQGRSRAGGVANPDKFTSALRIGSAYAEEMGTIRQLTSTATRLWAPSLDPSLTLPPPIFTIAPITPSF